jgi:hypothetical protein
MGERNGAQLDSESIADALQPQAIPSTEARGGRDEGGRRWRRPVNRVRWDRAVELLLAKGRRMNLSTVRAILKNHRACISAAEGSCPPL